MMAMSKKMAQSNSRKVGCRQFDVCQDQQNLNNAFLCEIYDDEATSEAHKAAPHYHVFKHVINGIVVKNQFVFCKI